MLSLLCFIFIGEVQSCKFDHSRLFRHKFREVLLIRAVGRFQFPARFMLLIPSVIFLAERKTCFPARIEARTVSRVRNADQTARICQRFLYSMVEITRSYDLIKHGRHISLRHSGGAQRFVGFFLVCSFRVLIGWAIKLQSRGCDNCIRSGQVVHGNQKFYHWSILKFYHWPRFFAFVNSL